MKEKKQQKIFVCVLINCLKIQKSTIVRLILNNKERQFQIELLITGDMPFLCNIYGHKGHSSQHPCVFCYALKSTKVIEWQYTNSEQLKK